ncbi:hypothetical protein [Roseobacter weihaiensis]|uniref:hypothetical protein n=1 Tax=Roseobacter weihaiensis TaxID=2763262 RepID=UPI001D0AD4C2|nr:hypothetical protein [Roseobacter sp. H9]
MIQLWPGTAALPCALILVGGAAFAHGIHIPEPCGTGEYTHLSGAAFSWDGSEGHIVIDSIPISEQRFEFVLSFDVLLDERHADGLSHFMIYVTCQRFNMLPGPVELVERLPNGLDFRFGGLCTGEVKTPDEVCGEEVHG